MFPHYSILLDTHVYWTHVYWSVLSINPFVLGNIKHLKTSWNTRGNISLRYLAVCKGNYYLLSRNF